MSTPTCLVCGTKFPGDPCTKCGAPKELSPEDVAGYKRMVLYDQGHSKRAVKRIQRQRPGTRHQKRRAHGRQ